MSQISASENASPENLKTPERTAISSKISCAMAKHGAIEYIGI